MLGPKHWDGATEAEWIDTMSSLRSIAVSAREGRWVGPRQGIEAGWLEGLQYTPDVMIAFECASERER